MLRQALEVSPLIVRTKGSVIQNPLNRIAETRDPVQLEVLLHHPHTAKRSLIGLKSR